MEWLAKRAFTLQMVNYKASGKKVGKWFYYTNETVKEVDYNENVIASLKETSTDNQDGL